MAGRGALPSPGLLALILAVLASSSVAQTMTAVITTTAAPSPASTPSPSSSDSAVQIPGYSTVYFATARVQAGNAFSLLASGTRSGVFIQEDGFPASTLVSIRHFPYNTPSANMPATASVASDALSFFFSQTAAKDVDVNIELLPLLQNSDRRQTIKCPDCEFKLHVLDKVKNEWTPICESDYRNNPAGQPKSVQGTVPMSALNITLFNPSSGCTIPGCDGRGGLFAVFSTVQCKDLTEFESSATAGIILAVILGSLLLLCCSTLCWYFCRRYREKKQPDEDEDEEVQSMEQRKIVVPSPQPSPQPVSQYPPIQQYVHHVPAYPPSLPQQPQQVTTLQGAHAVDGFAPVPGFGDHPAGLGGSPQLSYQVPRSYQLPGSSPVASQQLPRPTVSQQIPHFSPQAPPGGPYTNPPSWM